MKHALIITTISGFVPQFEQEHLKILQNMGYQIHYASNFNNPHYGSDNHRLEGTGMICHQINFVRSPFLVFQNLQAYRQLKKLFQAIPFDLVHCHTPMGGVLGRLAARSMPQIKVLYTAHGFHFFRGAPFRNWLLYYPVERWLAHITDGLITINQEDYLQAKRFHLRKGGKVYRVNGVGISLTTSSRKDGVFLKERQNREGIRSTLGILPEEYVFLSIGELSRRKNHQIVIRALKRLAEKTDISFVRYFICGEGRERNALRKLIQRSRLEQQVILLGYQENVEVFLKAADCFILPSRQEGLPVALLEAMREGLPIIASKIRGSRELVEGEAVLVAADKKEQYADAMEKIMRMGRKRRKYSRLNDYSESYVTEQMKKIYRENLTDK